MGVSYIPREARNCSGSFVQKALPIDGDPTANVGSGGGKNEPPRGAQWGLRLHPWRIAGAPGKSLKISFLVIEKGCPAKGQGRKMYRDLNPPTRGKGMAQAPNLG